MKKKLITSILVASVVFANFSNSYAQEVNTQESSIVLQADKTPVFEGGSIDKSSRANPILVASDVQHIYSGFGRYTYAWGYTTLKKDGSDYYHYTRTEVRKGSTTLATSPNDWGYGYVETESDDAKDGLDSGVVAKVFYGW